jgi:hypothetical protein
MNEVRQMLTKASSRWNSFSIGMKKRSQTY